MAVSEEEMLRKNELKRQFAYPEGEAPEVIRYPEREDATLTKEEIKRKRELKDQFAYPEGENIGSIPRTFNRAKKAAYSIGGLYKDKILNPAREKLGDATADIIGSKAGNLMRPGGGFEKFQSNLFGSTGDVTGNAANKSPEVAEKLIPKLGIKKPVQPGINGNMAGLQPNQEKNALGMPVQTPGHGDSYLVYPRDINGKIIDKNTPSEVIPWNADTDKEFLKRTMPKAAFDERMMREGLMEKQVELTNELPVDYTESSGYDSEGNLTSESRSERTAGNVGLLGSGYGAKQYNTEAIKIDTIDPVTNLKTQKLVLRNKATNEITPIDLEGDDGDILTQAYKAAALVDRNVEDPVLRDKLKGDIAAKAKSLLRGKEDFKDKLDL